MNKWKDSSLTLGERCVAFAENELANNVKEDKPKSYTSPRIREYFSICTRILNGKETKVSIASGNWCAASVSFCLYNSLLPNEEKPHGFRLGVVEIVQDVKVNGRYKSVVDVKNKIKTLNIGDPVFFDRSDPKNPASSWWRHVGFVQSITPDGFKCISGNSGGKWSISSHKLSQVNLIGFGDYKMQSADIYFPDNVDHLTIDELTPKEDTGADLDNFFGVYKDFKFGPA